MNKEKEMTLEEFQIGIYGTLCGVAFSAILCLVIYLIKKNLQLKPNIKVHRSSQTTSKEARTVTFSTDEVQIENKCIQTDQVSKVDRFCQHDSIEKKHLSQQTDPYNVDTYTGTDEIVFMMNAETQASCVPTCSIGTQVNSVLDDKTTVCVSIAASTWKDDYNHNNIGTFVETLNINTPFRGGMHFVDVHDKKTKKDTTLFVNIEKLCVNSISPSYSLVDSTTDLIEATAPPLYSELSFTH